MILSLTAAAEVLALENEAGYRGGTIKSLRRRANHLHIFIIERIKPAPRQLCVKRVKNDAQTLQGEPIADEARSVASVLV
jgi:hypothetical protein